MWKYGIILKCFARILNIPFLSYSNQYWYSVFCLWNFEKIFRICPWKHLCLKYLCFVFRILPFVCIVIVWLWKHLCLKSHLEEIFAFCLPLLVFVSNQFENTNIKGGRTVRPSTSNCPEIQMETSSVDAIAIYEIWNYHYLKLSGVRRCFRVLKLICHFLNALWR